MPGGVTAAPASSTSIKAAVIQAADPTGVHHYVVEIQGETTKNCQPQLGELFCTIDDLLPAKQYTVQVKACLDESSGLNPCSPVQVGGQGWTKPTSTGLSN